MKFIDSIKFMSRSLVADNLFEELHNDKCKIV